MSFRSSRPPRQLKKGIDADESRHKRQEGAVELRKNKREESMQKRRHVMEAAGGLAAAGGADAAAGHQSAASLQATAEAKANEILAKLQQLPQLVSMVMSNDEAAQIAAVTDFRKLLSIEKNPPIDQVIESGVVPRLVELLKTQSKPILQFESAWALTNIASGTSKHTRCVIDNGAIPVFVSLLTSSHEDVREQAVWALGNIAGDSAQCRDRVLGAGALKPLLNLCTTDAKITMLRNATWSLSNLCRGKPQPDFSLVEPALPVLARLLFVLDDEVLTDACWALSYLSDDTGPQNAKIQAVIQCGVAKRLVELLMHKSPNVKTPALRTVGNIVTGDDVQTQVCINCGVMPCLLALLVNPKKSIRKEACWTISNITAGNTDQIEQVITHNLIAPLISILQNEDFDIQKEAAWAISNATSGGSDAQIRYIAAAGAIKPLCDLFSCQDPKIIMVAMEGVENILRVGKLDAQSDPNQINPYGDIVASCKGLDQLEALQMHENEEIYQKARTILSTYFESEEADGEDIVGGQETQQEGMFQYQGGQAPQGGFNF